jgi:hypothetical protein
MIPLKPAFGPNTQKTYLSRSVSRAMSMDHPVGDPFGGPAYGERRDPISAIISVATMYGASAGFTFVGMTLASGMVFAGAAMSLVGNVTGNSTLTKIGMVTGLAGAAGSFLAPETFGSVFPGGETSSTGTTGTETGASTTTNSLSQSPANMVDSGDIATVSTSGGDVAVNATGNTAVNAPTDGLINSQAQVAGPITTTQPVTTPLSNAAAMNYEDIGAIASPGTSVGNVGLTTDVGSSIGQVGASNVGQQASVVQTPFKTALADLNVTPSVNASMGTIPPESGTFDNLLAFANKNPGATMMASQAIGQAAGAVGDVVTGKSAATVDQLKADTAYRQALADKTRRELELEAERRRRINANAGTQLAFSANPNAVTINKPGLINAARA